MPLRVCFVVHELYSQTNLLPRFSPQWSRTLWRWQLLLRLSRKWRGTLYSWVVRSHARHPSILTFPWAGTCVPLMTPILDHVTWSPCQGTLFCGQGDSTVSVCLQETYGWTRRAPRPTVSPSTSFSPQTRESSTARPRNGFRTQIAPGTPWPGKSRRRRLSKFSPQVSTSCLEVNHNIFQRLIANYRLRFNLTQWIEEVLMKKTIVFFSGVEKHIF